MDVLLHAVVVRDVVLSIHRLVNASRGGGTSRFAASTSAASTSAASTSAAAAMFVRTWRGTQFGEIAPRERDFVGIVETNAIAKLARGLIRIGDVSGWDLGEFGHPRFDVFACRIVILCLFGNVESIDTTARHASRCAPVTPV